jgi:nucleotide-binding universal stress UspA family protein
VDSRQENAGMTDGGTRRTIIFCHAPNIEDEVVQGAERELEKFEQQFFAGYPTKKRAVLKGDPVDQIIAYIRAEKIDLVVMGTHGRKGIDKIIFGSVADRMVKNSPVPVMMMNAYRKA